MTATPKVYMERKDAKKNSILRYSMDDEEKFGRDFYKYSFSKAIEEGVLSDYRIVVFKLNQDLLQQRTSLVSSSRGLAEVCTSLGAGIVRITL